MGKILGISLFVLALAIGIIPQFTHCKEAAADASSRMPCQQSARAEIAIAIPLGVVGAAAALTSRKNSLFALSAVASVLGISAILIPTALVGTCPGEIMRCNILMKPFLLGLGTLTILGGITGMIVFRMNKPGGLKTNAE